MKNNLKFITIFSPEEGYTSPLQQKVLLHVALANSNKAVMFASKVEYHAIKIVVETHNRGNDCVTFDSYTQTITIVNGDNNDPRQSTLIIKPVKCIEDVDVSTQYSYH